MAHKKQYVKMKISKLNLYFQFDGANSTREPAHVMLSHNSAASEHNNIRNRMGMKPRLLLRLQTMHLVALSSNRSLGFITQMTNYLQSLRWVGSLTAGKAHSSAGKGVQYQQSAEHCIRTKA